MRFSETGIVRGVSFPYHRVDLSDQSRYLFQMGESLKAIFAMGGPALSEALSKNLGIKVADLGRDGNALDAAARRLKVDDQYSYGEWCRILAGCTGPLGGHFVPNGFGCFSLATLTGLQKARALLLTRFYSPAGCRYKVSKHAQRAWVEWAPPRNPPPPSRASASSGYSRRIRSAPPPSTATRAKY